MDGKRGALVDATIEGYSMSSAGGRGLIRKLVDSSPLMADDLLRQTRMTEEMKGAGLQLHRTFG